METSAFEIAEWFSDYNCDHYQCDENQQIEDCACEEGKDIIDHQDGGYDTVEHCYGGL